jgi:hypothetical protein
MRRWESGSCFVVLYLQIPLAIAGCVRADAVVASRVVQSLLQRQQLRLEFLLPHFKWQDDPLQLHIVTLSLCLHAALEKLYLALAYEHVVLLRARVTRCTAHIGA